MMDGAVPDRTRHYAQHEFGATVPTEERNAVGHVEQRLVDSLGRVTATTDANGVQTFTTFDAWGRVVQVELQGVSGPRLLKLRRSYRDDAIPHLVTSEHFRDNVLVGTTLEVLDGFGRSLQHWAVHAEGGWVVRETELDARGLLRWTSEPHREAQLPVDYVVDRPPEVLPSTPITPRNDYQSLRGTTDGWSYYDELGGQVLGFSQGTQTTRFNYSDPGTVQSTDASGFRVELESDTLGRLVEVRQGNSSHAPSPTGRYAYDGRGRITRFEDGAGNQWFYDYDLAGRLRAVQRQGVGDLVPEAYYAYVWQGLEPLELHEGSTGGDWDVRWSYDPLGRPVLKEVRDIDPLSLPLQYTWVWDEGPHGRWYGALHEASDPYGKTTFTFEADPTYGSLGYPTEMRRDFSGRAPVHSAVFSLAYDEDGRETHRTWPSGTTVNSMYAPTGQVIAQDLQDGAIDATVTYSYDRFGLSSGWMLDYADAATGITEAWSQLIDRREGGLVGFVGWDGPWPVEQDKALYYHQAANGDLQCKSGTLGGDAIVCYEYDAWHRISRVLDPRTPTALFEAYTYDAASNPTGMQRERLGGHTDVWSYTGASRFNEFASRSEAGGAVDHFDYDHPQGEPALGRMYGWQTTGVGVPVNRRFSYDGEGRLTRVERVGSSTTDLGYTVGNALVFEQRTGAVSGQTFRFEGWQERDGEVVESPLPMLRRVGSGYRVAMTELDGHAVWTTDIQGHDGTQEMLGAYGLPIERFSHGPGVAPWDLDSLHGGERDLLNEVVHRGARHLPLRDGVWLQPEPLLHKGLVHGSLVQPLGFSGLYAGGDTNAFSDPDGHIPIPLIIAGAYVAFEVAASLYDGYSVLSAASVAYQDPTWQNVGSFALEAGGAGLGLVAPGGGYSAADDVATGAGRLLMSGADEAADATRAAMHGSDEAADAARALSEGCFVAGTEVVSADGWSEVNEVGEGDRVVAAASTDGGAEPWVEVEDAPVEERGAWAPRGVCDRVTAWAPKWAMPAMVALAACGVEPELPASDEVVQVYDARTGDWSETSGAELEVGDTWLDDGRLHRWTEGGVEDRGAAASAFETPAASTDGGELPWVELEDAPVEERGAWAPRGVCDRVTTWAPKWAMPAMVALAACGVEPELPAPDEVVQVYDARAGDWSEAVGADLEVGDTWLDEGRLHRWTDDGVEDRGEATVEDLAEADATWTAEAATRVPGTDAWVLVLGEDDEAGSAPGASPGGAGTAASDSSHESGHWKLGAVEAGDRFAFQGRVFETADADGDGLIEVRPTGDVLGRVVNTFVRVAPEVIDANIEYADGSTDTLTGTPNHPFWVDAVRDYVPLGELEVGTVLHVQGGGEAILVGKTWRQGDFEVFDIEVEGLHNFYVRGEGSDAAGVLVHNSTGGEFVYRHADEAGNTTYIGITNSPARRAGEHAADPGKSGTMEVLTGAVDHDTARTIEGKLIRGHLDEATMAGKVDPDASIADQLGQAGLNNKNRGRTPDRWNNANPEDHIQPGGETFDVNGP